MREIRSVTSKKASAPALLKTMLTTGLATPSTVPANAPCVKSSACDRRRLLLVVSEDPTIELMPILKGQSIWRPYCQRPQELSVSQIRSRNSRLPWCRSALSLLATTNCQPMMSPAGQKDCHRARRRTRHEFGRGQLDNGPVLALCAEVNRPTMSTAN